MYTYGTRAARVFCPGGILRHCTRNTNNKSNRRRLCGVDTSGSIISNSS